jgi:hypothetical protein
MGKMVADAQEGGANAEMQSGLRKSHPTLRLLALG